MERSRWSLPMRVYTTLVVLYLFFPVAIILVISFSADRFLSFPPSSWGLRWYRAFFESESWLSATWRSLRIGLFAALVSTLCGTLLSIWLARSTGRWVAGLRGLALAPALVPNILLAVGLFIVMVALGATDSEALLVLAHAALGLPFVVLILGAALADTDPTLERAARVMGAGPIRAFMTGTLPGLQPAIAAALLFSFFTSFDELIVALFTMGGQATLPVRMWADLQFEINPTVSAVSVLLIIVTTVGMSLAEVLRRHALRRES